MRVNLSSNNVNSLDGFYVATFDVFAQTLEESTIEHSIDMGSGVVIHHGKRHGLSVWLLDNPLGRLYGIWIEDERPAA